MRGVLVAHLLQTATELPASHIFGDELEVLDYCLLPAPVYWVGHFPKPRLVLASETQVETLGCVPDVGALHRDEGGLLCLFQVVRGAVGQGDALWVAGAAFQLEVEFREHCFLSEVVQAPLFAVAVRDPVCPLLLLSAARAIHQGGLHLVVLAGDTISERGCVVVEESRDAAGGGVEGFAGFSRTSRRGAGGHVLLGRGQRRLGTESGFGLGQKLTGSEHAAFGRRPRGSGAASDHGMRWLLVLRR
mmetsp:Transcript_1286/g.2866  ORF Transcript_1286/g.2866 Transcript_1286/m.2866 type:complete len:246 (-) Transcript_1286:53-790(-)